MSDDIARDGDDTFVATVPESLAGVRVDRAVALLTGVSRAAAASLVAEGRVTVGGRPVAGRSVPLVAGTELVVTLPEVAETAVSPELGVAFTVVHEDEDLVVVDKPAGLVVHPGAGNADGTLIAGLVARYPDIAELGKAGGDPSRPGIVHRIDRGTSGLLVVARTPRAYRSLAAQMGARTVGRRYLALVAGNLADDQGIVDAPIGRSQRTPTKMAIASSGRAARTSFVVLGRLDEVGGPQGHGPLPATLVACRLETGRTHQIRVHLAAIGHPVMGDDRYGPGGRVGGGLLPPGRLFLHAAELAFDHPATGALVGWESELPADLATVVGEVVALPPAD